MAERLCPRCKKRAVWRTKQRNNWEYVCKRCSHTAWAADQQAQRAARRTTRDTGDASSSDLSCWEHGFVASAAGRWRSGSVEVIRWTCWCCGHDDGCTMQVSPAGEQAGLSS